VKKVLILCTGNSCRSIMAEALVNKYCEGIQAYSGGVKASGKVNPYAVEVLKKEGAWKSEYHSKVLDEVINLDFDLIVTVCDNAKENCPMFPKKVKTHHVGFSDPDGEGIEAFRKTLELIKKELLPIIKEELHVAS
jgi:arsenate reductase